MVGWTKIAAGVLLGVAGTVDATNENVRKNLPAVARDLPENVRRRIETAVAVAREASARRREEILRELAEHERREQQPVVRPDPDGQAPRAAGEAEGDVTRTLPREETGV